MIMITWTVLVWHTCQSSSLLLFLISQDVLEESRQEHVTVSHVVMLWAPQNTMVNHFSSDSKIGVACLSPQKDVVRICELTEIKIRRMLKVSDGKLPQGKNIAEGLILSVLTDLDTEKVFVDLDHHMQETGVMENHVGLLIRSVTRSYIKICMHHLAKQNNQAIVKNNRVRKKLHKLVLFNHQWWTASFC